MGFRSGTTNRRASVIRLLSVHQALGTFEVGIAKDFLKFRTTTLRFRAYNNTLPPTCKSLCSKCLWLSKFAQYAFSPVTVLKRGYLIGIHKDLSRIARDFAILLICLMHKIRCRAVLMRPKKHQMKIYLTRDALGHLAEIAPERPASGTAGAIVEACKSWKGDLIELLYHITHPPKEEK